MEDALYHSKSPQRSRTVRRKVMCITIGVVVLIILICAIAIPLARQRHDDNGSSSHNSTASLSAACAVTLYPTECISSLSSLTNDSNIGTNAQDLVIYSINAASSNLNAEVTGALNLLNTSTNSSLHVVIQDCLDHLKDSLDSLNQTLDELKSLNIQTLSNGIANMQTWTSSALTFHETCLDSFEEMGININGHVGDFLLHGNYTLKLLSNALAFVNTLKNIAGNLPSHRRLLQESTFVEKLERRLLQTTTRKTVTVAQDGTADFLTIQEAVDGAPSEGNSLYVIVIKGGRYVENVLVPKSAPNVVFVGDGMGVTIITGSRSVIGSNVTTSTTATLTVRGDNFIGQDFTVENTAGAINHQAVALRVTGDLAAFQRCEMIGFQDTLYVHANRQFFTNCRIIGTVDFIFGNAAVVLQNCTILATTGLVGQQNTYTASGRSDPGQNTGISIQNCTIDGTESLKTSTQQFPSFYGRPWKIYARTVVMKSTIGDVVDPAGWINWNGDTGHYSTIYYAEFRNTGPGSSTLKRVPWASQITSMDDAMRFAVGNFIQGPTWLPQTTITFQDSI